MFDKKKKKNRTITPLEFLDPYSKHEVYFLMNTATISTRSHQKLWDNKVTVLKGFNQCRP